jgi:hypothetical protein
VPSFRSAASIIAAGLAICAFLAAPAKAQLTWQDTKIELRSDSTAPTLEARFHFINSGTRPVQIQRVETSCGCTTAKLDEPHIAPGKAGDIVVSYARGAHTGLQTNLIAVQTDAGPPTLLTLLVRIPEVVRLDPEFVSWTHDEPKTPKTIQLKLLVPGKITALEVQSSDPDVGAQVRATGDGRQYRLVISPPDVHTFLRAVLTITCELDGKERKTFTSYATVQPSVSP